MKSTTILYQSTLFELLGKHLKVHPKDIINIKRKGGQFLVEFIE